MRGLLSINQSLLSTVMYAVLVVFTAELLIVSPWSVYAVMSQTIEVNSAYLLIFQAYIEAPEIAVLTLFDTCLCLIVFHFFAKNKVGLKQVAMGVVRSASLGSIKRAMSWKNIQNNNTSNNFLAMPTSPSVDASRPKRTEECLKVIVQSVKRFLLPCLLCSWASMLLALSSSAYVMKDDEQNKYAVLSSVGIVFTAIHLVFFQHFVINLKGMSRLYRASNSFPTSDVVDDKIVSIGVSAFNTSIYDTNLVVPPLPSSNLIAAGGGGGVAVGGSTTTKPMPARRSSFFGQTELAESPDLTSPLIVATGTIPEKIQMASPKSPNQPQSFSNIIEMYHIRD